MKEVSSYLLCLWAIMVTSLLFFSVDSARGAGVSTESTVIVSAEGLADPDAEIFQKDKGLMVDELRRDARRQVIEKAVGTFVESSTLVQNYELINDQILTRSKGMIKRIIKETAPIKGADGLMHMFIKAEVFLSEVKSALKSMSKENRLALIKERGNPTISVAIIVRDSKRGKDAAAETSQIAENILKRHFVNFGYRVWSEDYTKMLRGEIVPDDEHVQKQTSKRRVADFSVLGEARFKRNSITLRASGITLTKHVLTSWTVKCINNHTGEELYFNNKVPKKQSWSDEDEALQAIGSMIGDEFSEDFFKDHLNKPSQIMQIQMLGLPDYDTGVTFKKEFIGLRPVLNVDFRDFNAAGLSLYEIEFAGSSSDIAQIVNSNVIKPLNAKLGGNTFRLLSHHGNVVKIAVSSGVDAADLKTKLSTMPPSSLANASPTRIKMLLKNPQILAKVKEMNPGLKQQSFKENHEMDSF